MLSVKEPLSLGALVHENHHSPLGTRMGMDTSGDWRRQAGEKNQESAVFWTLQVKSFSRNQEFGSLILSTV